MRRELEMVDCKERKLGPKKTTVKSNAGNFRTLTLRAVGSVNYPHFLLLKWVDFLSLLFLLVLQRAVSYKRLMGLCRWIGSHFHDWIDYDGVSFSIELLEHGVARFRVFGVRQFFIFTVRKRTRMFVL